MSLRLARQMACLSVLVCLTTSSAASAQSPSETYALRRAMGNDAYVWEPMLRGALANSKGFRSTPPVLKQTGRPAERGRLYRKSDIRQTQAPPERFTANAGDRFTSQPRPFGGIRRKPTVSPYLNLFRDEINDTAANYQSYVRPQLEEQRADAAEQNELRRLRGRTNGNGRGFVQQTSAATPLNAGRANDGNFRSRRPASTSNVARFGDTGRYFGGRR